jgi:hypothetical protein
VDRIEDLGARVEGALLGVCIGEASAGAPAGAADLLGVAESLAATGGFDADDLRRRGLERTSKSAAAGLLLRGLPFGLLAPRDRPRLRREAFRCVSLAGADEATAITAVAVALLTADLLRFDVGTACVRLRQSLLEDAPMALLDRFRPGVRVQLEDELHDPGGIVQSAIRGLGDARGIAGVIATMTGTSPVAVGLAASLAGARDGLDGVDIERTRHEVAHAESAISIAHRLADRALGAPVAPSAAS